MQDSIVGSGRGYVAQLVAMAAGLKKILQGSITILLPLLTRRSVQISPRHIHPLLSLLHAGTRFLSTISKSKGNTIGFYACRCPIQHIKGFLRLLKPGNDHSSRRARIFGRALHS